jgi:hypothetical protein
VNGTGGSPFPLTVVLNHLRSLNGIDDTTPQGTGTEGDRVRAKRAAQAEYVADFVQSRQVADPAERIVVLGDLNAFEFSDGYVDVTRTIQGAPAPADQVVRPTSDLVDPDLSNLTTAASAGERYTYVFDGSAQALDHVLVSSALVAATSARRIEHARVGADFPETARNVPSTGLRLSDHDPAVAFLRPADTGASLYTLAPCRAIDTRTPADGPPLAAGGSRPFTLAGRCGIPTTARAVVVNIAVTSPTVAGHLRIHPTGTLVPIAAAINYGAGQTRANNAIVGLSAMGELSVVCNQASGTVHLVVDVSGYFE